MFYLISVCLISGLGMLSLIQGYDVEAAIYISASMLLANLGRPDWKGR